MINDTLTFINSINPTVKNPGRFFVGKHYQLLPDSDMLLQYTDYWHSLIFEQSES